MADAGKKKEDKKDPDPIDHFYAKLDTVNSILATRPEAAHDAHTKGIDALVEALKKNDSKATRASIKGHHLKNKTFKDIYLKAVEKHLVDSANKELGLKDHKYANDAQAEIHQGQLLRLYTGLTRENLRTLYDKFTEAIKFDPSQFHGVAFGQIIGNTEQYKAVAAGLHDSVGSHLNDSHLEKVVDKAGIKDYIVKNKEKKYDFGAVKDKRALAIDLLREFYNGGKTPLTAETSYDLFKAHEAEQAHARHADLKKQQDKLNDEATKLYSPPKKK